MNILIVHNYYKIPGGEDTVVKNEINMLESKDNNVLLYSRDNTELDRMKRWKKFFLPITFIFNPKTYFKIRKTIKENNIDVVHVHNTLTLISPAVYYAAKSLGVPVVQTIHNFRLVCPGAMLNMRGIVCEKCLKGRLFSAIKYRCYRNSRLQTLLCVVSMKIHQMLRIYKKIYYICLTDFNKEKLCNHKQISQDRVFVKPNFNNQRFDFKLNVTRDNEYAYVGRIDSLKGVDFLIKSWHKMNDNSKILHIYGVGPLIKWCHEYINENHINNIIIHGFIENNEVYNVLQKVKALILPTQWYEGFPMTIVEAYSVGTSVIGSDIGNTGSLIINGITGYKFKLNDYNEFYNAINKNLEINQLVYDYYKNNFTEERNYQMLMNIYSTIKRAGGEDN